MQIPITKQLFGHPRFCIVYFNSTSNWYLFRCKYINSIGVCVYDPCDISRHMLQDVKDVVKDDGHAVHANDV